MIWIIITCIQIFAVYRSISRTYETITSLTIVWITVQISVVSKEWLQVTECKCTLCWCRETCRHLIFKQVTTHLKVDSICKGTSHFLTLRTCADDIGCTDIRVQWLHLYIYIYQGCTSCVCNLKLNSIVVKTINGNRTIWSRWSNWHFLINSFTRLVIHLYNVVLWCVACTGRLTLSVKSWLVIVRKNGIISSISSIIL